MPRWIMVAAMGAVFTTVLAGGQGLYWAWVSKKERDTEELLRRLGSGAAGAEGEEAEMSLFKEETKDSVASAMGALGDRMHETLRAADAPYGVSNLILRMVAMASLGFLIGGFMAGPVGLFLGIPLAFVPYILVSFAASKRLSMIVEQLPDTLDLMARSLSAGLGLNDAFKLAAEEMPMPIAGEFARLSEEIRFGREYREAFNKLLERNPGLFDLRLFVSSVLLQRETGGNLIEILESISTMIRGRFLFAAKVRAMTSEARMSAVILGGLPFAVLSYLTLTNPTYVAPLFTHILGNLILVVAGFMYMLGGWLMYDLSKVEV